MVSAHCLFDSVCVKVCLSVSIYCQNFGYPYDIRNRLLDHCDKKDKEELVCSALERAGPARAS